MGPRHRTVRRPGRAADHGANASAAASFRALEAACIDHAGTARSAAAHARADPSGLERDLAQVRVPFLVIEAPEDPINPPPHAAHLAAQVPGSRLVTVAGMGHALPPAVVPEVTRILLDFCATSR